MNHDLFVKELQHNERTQERPRGLKRILHVQEEVFVHPGTFAETVKPIVEGYDANFSAALNVDLYVGEEALGWTKIYSFLA